MELLAGTYRVGRHPASDDMPPETWKLNLDGTVEVESGQLDRWWYYPERRALTIVQARRPGMIDRGPTYILPAD